MIDPGKMRHRITFQRFTGKQDEFGDPIQADDSNWEDVVTVWAAIDPLKGREFYAAQQSQSEITHNVYCRYRAGLNSAMRIKYRTRKFSIESIIDHEERHQSLLIKCKELVQ